MPCDTDKLPQGCYYKSCAYGNSSRQECNKYYIWQKSDSGCWICDDCYKEVPTMDVINGLKKRIITEQ